jgi:hypothetical protein
MKRCFMIGPAVYVFASGEPGYYGLSLDNDGRDLPALEGKGQWIFHQQVTMADGDLLPFVEDLSTARSRLVICGNYHARPPAT